MKTKTTILLTVLTMAVIAARCAAGATVTFHLERFTGATNNRLITISMATDPLAINTNIVFGVPLVLQPTGGVATATLLAANYWVRIDQVAQAMFMPVPDSTNAYNAIDLIQNGLKHMVFNTNYVVTTTNSNFVQTNETRPVYLIGGLVANGAGVTNVQDSSGLINVPFLNRANEFQNNNVFDAGVQFNGGLTLTSTSVLYTDGKVQLGTKGTSMNDTNIFQVVAAGGTVNVGTNGILYGNGAGLTNVPGAGGGTTALATTNSNGLQSSNDLQWRLNIPANYSILAEPTPRMGWISWPNVGISVNENVVKLVADTFYTNNLAALGYKWVVVDDSWGYIAYRSISQRSRSANVATVTIDAHSMATGDHVNVTGAGGTGYNVSDVAITRVDANHVSFASTGSNEGVTSDSTGVLTRTNFNYRDADGFIRVDTNRFPSCVDGVGMKPMADYCHARGLKFGLQASAEDLSEGHMTGATNVVADGKAFGLWGIDYIKRDNVGSSTGGNDPDFSKCRLLLGSWLKYRAPASPVSFYVRFIDNVLGNNYGFEPWMSDVFTERANNGAADPSVMTWTNNYVHFIASVTNFPGWTGPGHYAAADWISFGGGGTEDMFRSRTVFSMYSMASIPIELGSAFYNLTNGSGQFTDYWGWVYTNAAVIAVNQDPAVIPCYALSSNTMGSQVWVKPLGGRESQTRAVAFMNGNGGTTTNTIGCSLASIGLLTNVATVIDLWSNTFAYVTNSISAVVDPHDTRMFKVTAGFLPWPTTFAWPGPTNGLDPSYPFQTYTAAGDVGVSSIGTTPSGFSVCRMMITNSQSTNITVHLPSNLVTVDGGHDYTLAGGQEASLRVDVYAGHPQGEFRTFYVGPDLDAAAFFTRASIVDSTQKSAVNTLVLNLKGHGTWTKLDAFYPFVGASATPHSFNLVNTNYTITWHGVTHDAAGITGDAATAWGDTGFNPTTAGGHFGTNSCSFIVYVGTQTPTDLGAFIGTDEGVYSGINRNAGFAEINGLNMATYQSAGVTMVQSSVVDFRGPILATRTASNVQAIYTNPNQAGDSTVATALPNITIGLLCHHSSGGADHPSNVNLRAAGFGGAMTAGDWATLKADLDTFEAALSRKVP